MVQQQEAEKAVLRMQQALNKNRQVELLLVARDGKVLVGPPNWSGRSLAGDRDATEGGDYVTGSRAHLRLADGLGLGWTAIVRQRAELALAPARTTRRTNRSKSSPASRKSCSQIGRFELVVSWAV